MITWPSELPQAPLENWADEYVSGQVDHEEMTNPIRRRTYPDRAATFQFRMTHAERNALAAWWSATLHESAPFSAPWLPLIGYDHHVCVPSGTLEQAWADMRWLVTVPVRIVAVAPSGLPTPGALAASGLAAVADSYTTDSETAVAISVLLNDAGGSLSVVRVAGATLLVGKPVAGSSGGTFTIATNGTGVFDPGPDFAAGPSRSTSVTYVVSDGTHTAVGTVEVAVTWADDPSIPDPEDIALLINPQPGETSLIERTGMVVTLHGGAILNTEILPGGAPVLDLSANDQYPYTNSYASVGNAGDLNNLHNGDVPYTIELNVLMDETIWMGGGDLFSTTRDPSSVPGVVCSMDAPGSQIVDRNGHLRFYVYNGNGGETATGYSVASQSIILNQVFHVAITFDPWVDGGMMRGQIFLNGVRLAQWEDYRSEAFSSANCHELWLGALSETQASYMFDGDVHGARITEEILYTDTFVPPVGF